MKVTIEIAGYRWSDLAQSLAEAVESLERAWYDAEWPDEREVIEVDIDRVDALRQAINVAIGEEPA